MEVTGESGGIDAGAILQAAVNAAVQAALAAVASQGAKTGGGGVAVGDDTPLIEGAAAVAAQGAGGGSSENAPYFVPGFSGEGSSSGVCGNFWFDPDTKTIRHGFVIVARTPILTDSTTVSSAGYVYIEVDHSSTNPTATIVSGSLTYCPTATDTKTYIPLYLIGETDGELTVWQDYRGAPQIQVME